MRSSLLFRVLIVVALLAIIGVPGLRALDPTPAEAMSSVHGMPASNVWSGVLAAPGEAPASADGAEPTESLIVRFRPQASRGAQMSAHQQAGARRAEALALADTVRVDVPASQRDGALASYNARPDVLYAEPDYEVHALYTPNDPLLPSQWGLQKIGAQAAWDRTHGSPSVKVAVVDCGIFDEATGRRAPDGQPGHPDLRGRVAANQDFTSSSTGFDDYCDHGTHVAGIIGAAANNGIGVAGLAHEVTLLNAKVLDDSGSGSSSNILNGIVWSVQNGAKVINMSLGREGDCLRSERDTINWAWSQGVIVVAAAGNSGSGASGAPANCDNVISVASTTRSDERSSFSNYGTNVDVAAPGSDILSTIRTGEYASFNGTSMATPYVSALAGLIWSQNLNMSPQAVVGRIRTTADPIAGTGSLWAWGRINAAAALDAGGPPATPTVTSVPTSTSVPTATPTATATATSTSTPTPIPVPTRVICPSTRPPLQFSTATASATAFNVTVRAGAGVVRGVAFRDLRNVAITIESQDGVTSPFTYTPTTYAGALSFSVARINPSAPWNVGLAVTDDCGVWTTFVGGGANSGPRGQIAGTVRDAVTALPIGAVTVAVRETGRTFTTNGSGVFTAVDVPTGTVNLDVSAAGYTAQIVQATVVQGVTSTANVNLVPTAPLPPSVDSREINVALTWGSRPADLDVHMSGPASGGSRFHLFWFTPSVASYASISGDDNDGGGPETITIKKNPATGTWVPGEYRIWAHNYTGTPGFGDSSAKVTVTRGSETLGTYNVSSANGNALFPLWRVVTLTIDASGNVTLSPNQQFANGGSGTVLRLPEGPDGVVEWAAAGKP